jgi:organic radical activating enzyme
MPENKMQQLPVMELFYTLQGEGVHQGKAAVFVRLGGCDVGCVWCDVKESWDATKHRLMSIEQITEEVKKYKSDIVVITGGEPLMYNLDALTEALHQINKRTHLETSGAYALSGKWNWICVSPKKFKAPLKALVSQADELKCIIYNKHDYAWATQHAADTKASCALIIQPEWSREKEMLPEMIAFVKDNPQWRISLQTHKYMNIP